jgi:hypothetical protein
MAGYEGLFEIRVEYQSNIYRASVVLTRVNLLFVPSNAIERRIF